MRIDAGYILGYICEYLIFIYYSGTSFQPKKSYTHSNFVSLCGYLVLFALGLIKSAPLSIIIFFTVNVVLLMYCYNVKLVNAVFYSLMLDTLSCIGEYTVIYFLGLREGIYIIVSKYQSIVISTIGKPIYLAGVFLLKKLTNKKIIYYMETPLSLAVIPLCTIICLWVFMHGEINILLFLFMCTIFLVINFITFYINTCLNNKNRELKILYEEYSKNKTQLSEYQLLSEKYESSKILQHDLYKQLDVLKGLISEDNSQAEKYIQKIRFAYREAAYTEYSDNKILNILFDQKIKECHNRGVEIHIHSSSPTLSFISEIDTVAIFSNMLDNAIEAAEQSEEKEIFVDLYTVNESYSAVKIENSADKEPIIRDGVLHTRKKNTDAHGIGIKSINNSLKNYKSELNWKYEKEKKFFRTTVLFNISRN